MFCSVCEHVDDCIFECKRKICPTGHVVCASCEENFVNCPICDMEITRFVCVEVKGKEPRLYFDYFGETSNEESSVVIAAKDENRFENLLRESESLQDTMEQLKSYGIDHCFKVEEPKSFSTIASKNKDDKGALKYFEILDKSTKHDKFKVIPMDNDTKSKTMPSVLPLKSCQALESLLLKDRQVQTSKTFAVDKGAGDSEIHQTLKALKTNSRAPSQNFYPVGECDNDEDQITVESCDNASFCEFYFNAHPWDDSDTAHFTSITVTRTDPSPPVSPSKKGIPSSGHRVKFSTIFMTDGTTPAQMEPIAVFETDSSESSDSSFELPSDSNKRLPRFPVRCPITNCGSWSVPSDFCNHVTFDHPYIDVQKTSPERLINTKINYKGNANMVTCQRLFLLGDKITDIGYGAFENCLPIMLLTSKMSLRKTFGFSTNDNNLCDEIFYIYLAGVYQFPINYTITFWIHGRDDFEPTIIKSMSNSVFFMNTPCNPKEVAGNAIGISRLELQKLTNDESNMLSCQIMFH